MARRVEYVDSFLADSSVIAAAYLVDNGDAYVEFKTGRIAGYKGVGASRFAGLKAQTTAFNGSVGRYYNDFIKNFYTGLNGDVFFVQKNNNLVNVAAKNYGVVTNYNTSKFDVIYTDEQGRDVTFPVDATSETDALKMASDALSKFGGLRLKVSKVIHYFV